MLAAIDSGMIASQAKQITLKTGINRQLLKLRRRAPKKIGGFGVQITTQTDTDHNSQTLKKPHLALSKSLFTLNAILVRFAVARSFIRFLT